MAKEILKTNFRVGQEIKLKNYTGYSDYASHKDQIGMIIGIDKGLVGNAIRIKWQDDETSVVGINNLILVNHDWDE